MNDEGGNGRSGSHGSSGRSGSHGRSNGRGRGECKTELLQKRNVPFPFVVDWSKNVIEQALNMEIQRKSKLASRKKSVAGQNRKDLLYRSAR